MTPSAGPLPPRTMATGLRFPEGPVALEDGSVVLVEIARGTLTRIAPDGAATIVATPGDGPNGLAAGPGGHLYVCNNGGFLWHDSPGLLRPVGTPDDYSGGRIERVDPATGHVTTLYTHCDGHPLCGPNDLVFDGHGGFWFTDLGKSRARTRDHGGVYYARADGSHIACAAYPVLTPNGIGLSPDGDTLYVAETETARLWAFPVEGPGVLGKQPFPSPHGGRLVCGLPGFARFDSLAVDADGNVCVATLVTGCISVIEPGRGGQEGRLLHQVPTGDPYTTNICFGGPDRRTAYVTLSGEGRLVCFDWGVPGLRLHHQ